MLIIGNEMVMMIMIKGLVTCMVGAIIIKSEAFCNLH